MEKRAFWEALESGVLGMGQKHRCGDKLRVYEEQGEACGWRVVREGAAAAKQGPSKLSLTDHPGEFRFFSKQTQRHWNDLSKTVTMYTHRPYR